MSMRPDVIARYTGRNTLPASPFYTPEEFTLRVLRDCGCQLTIIDGKVKLIRCDAKPLRGGRKRAAR